MHGPSAISIVFVAIALILMAAAFRDYLKAEGKMTFGRKVWIRMAIIFAAVGIGLCLVQLLFFFRL